MPIDITSWGISTTNSPSLNSKNFNENIESGQTLYLPGNPDPYPYEMINFINVDNVEFYGDSDTVIKFVTGVHFI